MFESLKTGHAIACLRSVIAGDLRPVEHEFVTLRSIALRMLVKTNRDLALTFWDTGAWKELKDVYNVWQKQMYFEEVQEELSWMIEAEFEQ